MTYLAGTASHPPQISGYKIVEQLYLGSRTAVYRAVQIATQVPVVIKVLRRERPSFGELVQFRNQFTIAKNLPLPGIVRPLSLEPLGSGYAIVMEDWGGVALGQYLQSQPLDWTEVLEITLQLADILHGLSQHWVVHKDIKPANILIHPESKQVKLIDFSIASLLSKETQEIQSPNILEGTLSYIAPEQTGRMNRGIDYRADFYALGVTLYQLLTGTLPFVSDDPLELIHYHLAQVPVPVNQVKAEIPEIVTAIVAKLMAKNAEDRYQSALGLKHDLQQCLTQWQETGAIAPFDLGERDVSDRFLIPEKLYGRQSEVTTLLDAFDRVAAGSSELMLVAGFSGIGKTAVVNEVHKPITRQQGYFIKGKFDQFNRNIPLSAFVQALRDLMGQLLSESDAQLAQWQAKILAAVGENGQVLIDVVPELEQIIGKQPIAAELSGSAAQNRFNLLFQTFIEVFTTADHPLVLFLDDLQWADLASLQLIKLLMHDNGYLLILGAYRDNEVSPAHPFILTVEELKKTGAIVNTITLAPLAFEDTNQLIADTLNCSRELAHPLTELIDRKTKGNPFFTTQFLKALHEDGQINFDLDRRYWTCDIVQVKALALTDDVVEFMALQLQKLPPETQQVLKLAACVGNQFDLATLAIVSEQSYPDTASALWKAMQEGLILPTSQVYKFFQGTEPSASQESVNPAYRFLHDRVQQAAYSLIPEESVQITHLRIGRLLLQNTSEQEREGNLFKIVNQFNIGIPLLRESMEREALAKLNLAAARKAKSSAVYDASVSYLKTAIDLMCADTMCPNAWQTHYSLMLQLHVLLAEVSYLNGGFEVAEQQIKIILENATCLLDCIKAYEIRIQLLVAQKQFQVALDVGLEILTLLNVSLNNAPLPNIDIDRLYNLPTITDLQIIAALSILSKLWAPAFIANPQLLPQIILTMLNLSVTHGNSATSAFAYALYGMLLCATMTDIELGYRFGQLAVYTLERHENAELTCKVNQLFHAFIRNWKELAHDRVECLAKNVLTGLETGDIEFACYSAINYCDNLCLIGESLASVHQKQAYYIELTYSLRQEIQYFSASIWGQFVENLMSTTVDPKQLVGQRFDERKEISKLRDANAFTALFFLYTAKTILYYLFDDYEGALAQSEMAVQYEENGVGLLPITQIPLYRALALLALYPTATLEQQAQMLAEVKTHQQRLEVWATHAPQNFQHKLDVIAAETSRILSNREQAIDLYDRAIAGAKANGYIQEEALANELAAKFYLGWGKTKIAQEYLTNAYYGYVRWGAKAKVQDLECRYPTLLAPILQQQQMALSATETVFATTALVTSQAPGTKSSTSGSTSISATLDLATVLKISQTLSSEIQLDKLLATLLHTVLENSGADKGALLMPRDNQWFVEAIATLDQPARVQSIALSSSSEIPHGLINTVRRSFQPVVIMDATIHPTLAMDPYVMQHQPKSLLCTPILQQGKLVTILYLENHVTVGAFTSDRVELLNFLCAQAAISLENARLYQQAQEDAQQLQRKEAQSRSIFEAVSDGLLITDLETGKVMDANPAYYQLHGYSYSEILSLDPLDFIPPNRHDKFAAFLKTVKAGQEFTCEAICKKRDGTPFYIELKSVPFLYNGKHCGLSVIRDVTERKYMEISIQEKNRTLEQAMTKLQYAQMQMIQSEKMSALGNLVAGVAHEINNPIGFLNGSIKNATEYARDLLEHLALYQQHYPNVAIPIQDHAEDIDLEFLSQDLPKLLNSMKGATDRIKSISTSLRIFSRADTEFKVSANLHEGIDSTLLILKYRLKANEQRPAIQVIQDYGELPPVECFPGQLNQVFMNILANAIDVFDEAAQGFSFTDLEAQPQIITIQTTALTEQNVVEIRIRDNGAGMAEDVKTRVFDHLFTTKGVGKGTGLGLAIAHQIVVESHGGRLEVQSELGQGSEFLIRLPIHT